MQLPLRWMVAVGIAWALSVFVMGELNPYLYSIVMYSGINVILAVSLNLVDGFTGQFSMGHAGLMAAGAYTAASVTFALTGTLPGDLLLLLSVGCGGAVAGAVGYLVGLPSLRLKGDYLAIVTLGFGEIIRVVLLNIEFLGGARGMPGIPQLTSFGWLMTFVILSIFVATRLVNSEYGREMLAVREDEIAAEAMGIHTTRTKVRAFVIASVFAGFAGGLFAHFLQYLNPAIFDFNRSFEVIIMVVLGGMGSITGSVVSAVILTVMKEALRPLQQITKVDIRMILYALVLIAFMLARPRGLLGKKELSDFFPWVLKTGLRRRARKAQAGDA